MKTDALKMSLVLAASLLLSVLSADPVQAAPGDLDPLFGNGGVVSTPLYYAVSDLAIQPDGKIIAAGAPLARYNADGSLDTTFGNGGTASSLYFDYAVAIQPDGKIVTAGIDFGTRRDPDFVIVRRNPDGSLDLSFGTGGVVLTPFGNDDDYAYALAIQPDGKIIAAGTSSSGLSSRIALARYDANGMLDPTFGSGGRVLTQISTIHDQADSIAVQSNGKLVVGASIGNATGTALLGYRTDGSLDTSFGIGGVVASPPGGIVAIQADGKIVAAGRSINGTSSDFALARYAANGSLDPSFGSTGKVLTSFSSGSAAIGSVVIQSNGDIIAAGSAVDLGVQRFALAKYRADGSLDTSFGSGGKVLTGISDHNDYVRAVEIQPDGKIVATGTTNFIDYSNDDFGHAMVRYNNADPFVNVAGAVFTPDGRGLRNAVVTLTDSQGIARTATTSSFGIYLFDGVTPDASYTITVSSKRYRFATRSIEVNSSLANVDFIGME